MIKKTTDVECLKTMCNSGTLITEKKLEAEFKPIRPSPTMPTVESARSIPHIQVGDHVPHSPLQHDLVLKRKKKTF